MSVSLNTNTAILANTRALRNATRNTNKSLEKLSTGRRINRAGDDAAGLSINQKLTTQLRSIPQIQQGIANGMGIIEQIDSALAVVEDNLHEIRELAVQGFNGTNSEDELAAIQREINERVRLISDVGAQEFELNGQAVDLSEHSIIFNPNSPAGMQDFDIVIGTSGETLTIKADLEFTTYEGFDLSILGPQGGLRSGPSGAASTNLANFNISTTVGSAAGTTVLDGNLDDLSIYLASVSRMRSNAGKYINTLESRYEYLDQLKEGYSSSQSHTSDTDFAKESSEYAREQIRQQGAASILSQANAQAGFVLNLLP